MATGNFTFKSDKKDFIDELSRKDIANLYVSFINVLDGHHVVALDAPWGSGKSTLINYMREEFENNNDVFVKYNAWENDYTEEPLLSLMSDIHKEFQEKQYIGVDEWKNFVSHMVKATKLLSKGTLKGISRIIAGTEATSDFEKACVEVSSAVTDETANNLFKDIDESKKSRKEFKEELKNYTNKILKEKSKDKLIIIIDELDRCRPTFAIELLENIKHLFDIQNIVFFIAVDCKQLAESIKAVYGNGFDADTYLHRFFDFELHLKKDSLGQYLIDSINEKFNVPNDILKFKEEYISTFNLTIRDINRIINELNILHKMNNLLPNQIEYFLILLCMKYKKRDFYKHLKENFSEYDENYLRNLLPSNFLSVSIIEKLRKDYPKNLIKRIEETI